MALARSGLNRLDDWTTVTLTHPAAPVTQPFRLFHVRVLRTQRLSPSFVRITFTGDDLDRFADNGYDQRIKLILPLAGRGFVDLPVGPDWYDGWRRLPASRRNPVRTYTARAVRPRQREVDVDMVLHGESGPASRLALHARPGDTAALLGPDALFAGRHGGVEFKPPAEHRGPFLLAADETALPALAGILERMPRGSCGEVVIEVPLAADRLHLDAPRDLTVTWVAREHATHGSSLVAKVRDAVARLDATPLYAWLAGESSAIKQLRRHLVTELGHDRRSVAFMGYWRLGRPEA